MNNPYIDIQHEVLQALNNKLPVVALESTIISHGMPYPQNIEMAKKTEQIIREAGAIPATIAIIGGRIKVGLNNEELEIIAKSKNAIKVSRRDIPYIITKKEIGATTVASTMIFAEMANIKVFVTGGIGGVHRFAQETFDISADLTELANTNVAVVCAGAKAILDLNLTMEYLETYGVPVIGFKTNELPAFYTRKSGIPLVQSTDNLMDLAQIIYTKWKLNLKGGLVIANPIPENFSMDHNYINKVINEALQKAISEKIQGKEITPFLLSEIKNTTQGKSLEVNIELVFNNAKLGAELAIELAKLYK